MWSERNVNETRLSSLSLASPRIPASARPSHPHPYPPHPHPIPHVSPAPPRPPGGSETRGNGRGWRSDEEWGTEARVRSRVWRVEWGTAGRCGEEGREPAKRREWETPGSDQPLSHSLPFVSRSFGVLSGSLRFPSVPLSDRAPKDEGREWGKGKEPRTRRCAHDFLFSSLTHLSHLSHRRPA